MSAAETAEDLDVYSYVSIAGVVVDVDTRADGTKAYLIQFKHEGETDEEWFGRGDIKDGSEEQDGGGI